MFNSKKFIKEQTSYIKDLVTGNVISGLSGGVDSTTATIMVHKAIGKKLLCVLVDTGLMRKEEIKLNTAYLKKLGLRLVVIDAQKQFFRELKGVTDPEKKRKIIGKVFIQVFDKVAKQHKAQYLVQGTIAPDWIESGGGLRDTIKSHHNVGGLPKKMGLKLIEPLRDLYKDEVRMVGKAIGLPAAIYQRQPFPGPGLAIRVLGEVTPQRVAVVREACAIVETEIEAAVKNKLITKPWQYFAVLLPVKAVGVHGDIRAYNDIVVIRSVETLDGMSATYSRLPHDLLEAISVKITNHLKDDVSRVVYDVTNKPPGTVEYE
ncbi:GMP synthase [Candidatus Roizmanbacteria bacterium RIFCSPHIGHO2_12_FULL_44_10]|uniref:GMP synthase (glutamine-hydrolyzing) n=1 Tax=Candidatus Roizmanbacteria bacterium RIFCSPHIGHO2_12_FULL_44_10 TaxID=1802054 RepID=A0A1F7IB46_9BACT|nr:MAG: GMP synthase [Candidatus Roizmanbacteria bacterium RIFCSPHIGHO2_12_FULL_44_10]